jgi:hypothetical protein
MKPVDDLGSYNVVEVGILNINILEAFESLLLFLKINVEICDVSSKEEVLLFLD